MYKTSCIICTSNREDHLYNTIQSVIHQVDELIIVGSQYYNNLKDYNIIFVDEGVSSGLSHARNLGVNQSSGNILFFIDDDAIASPNWVLSHLSHYINDDVGIVGGLVKSHDNTIQFKNGIMLLGSCPISLISSPVCISKLNHYVSNTVMGTNMSMRRSLAQFDTNITYMYDEADVCETAVNSGYIIEYENNSTVYHNCVYNSRRINHVITGFSTAYVSMKHYGLLKSVIALGLTIISCGCIVHPKFLYGWCNGICK